MLLTFFESLKVVLINIVPILMMSAKLAALDLSSWTSPINFIT